MDLYSYVAQSNPYQAKAIIHKYGYSTKGVKDSDDLGICLKKVVAYEGEDVFYDVLDSHPDRDVIVERYLINAKKNDDDKKCNCSGHGCSCHRDRYMNFNGNPDTPSKSVRDTSMYIMAAALLLAAAIIVKK